MSTRLLALSLGLLVGAAPAARATDWYVDAAASNCATATGTQSAPFCKIADALAVAVDGDTIHVAAGTYAENLLVDADVTLIGTSGAAATIVDGQNAGSVVVVSANASVAIEALTLEHGNAPHGGGIAVDQGTLALAGCQILTNTAGYDGGGIFNDGGTIVVTNSTIRGNRSGDATYYYYNGFGDGGGICNQAGSVTLVSSTLDSNRAGDEYYYLYTVGHGGAISSADGTLAIEDCEITNSFGRSGGGAIHDLNSTVTIARTAIRASRSSVGGAVYLSGSNAALEECDVSNNRAQNFTNGTVRGLGGGLRVTAGSVVALTDCAIADNVSLEAGGAICNEGDLTLTGCTVSGNWASDGWYDGYGGGIEQSGGSLTLVGCAIVDNEAAGAWNAFGGGIDAVSGTVTLTNCTVAGNATHDSLGGSPAGTGGGLRVRAASSVSIGHTIVAGNEAANAQNVGGKFASLGHDCLGDTSGTTITGNPTGNLLDVDPQFADPATGDFSLAATSPCLDAGDAALAPGGMDLARNPRLLDGDFDRVMVVDMGAFEFDHVHLDVTGTPTPGGTLSLATTGTIISAGLPVFLFAGVGQSELLFNKYGALFVDLGSPWSLFSWGTIPSSIDVDVDPTLPVPLTVHVQLLALDAASHSGNFGNLVTVVFE